MNAKIRVIATITIGTIIIIGTGLIATRLAQETAPEDTSATGFGPTATRDLFAPVHTTFKGIRCNTFFNTELLELIPSVTEITSVKLSSETAPFSNLSKWCEYDVGNDRKITFSITPYSATSNIDQSREELYTRINGLLLIDSVKYAYNNWFDVDYYFGDDAVEGSGCRANLYHFQNDFEYASISYQGFGNNCQKLVDLNDGIASLFSENIAIVMDTIDAEYGITFEDVFLDYEL